MRHPKATLHMENGADIVIELLPESAPNTVNSFFLQRLTVTWITMPLSVLCRETGWI